MANQQLVEYIAQQLANGTSEDTVKNILLSKNWLPSDIDDAYLIAKESPLPIAPNRTWSKSIPAFNNISMIISLILVFGLDLMILIGTPSLAPFYYEMLFVLVIFGLFFFYENYIASKKFSDSSSSLDKWFLSSITVRNIIFIINFIPLAQILGGLLLFFGGIPYLIFYLIMMYRREMGIKPIGKSSS